jgi:hypothetical protein
MSIKHVFSVIGLSDHELEHRLPVLYIRREAVEHGPRNVHSTSAARLSSTVPGTCTPVPLATRCCSAIFPGNGVPRDGVPEEREYKDADDDAGEHTREDREDCALANISHEKAFLSPSVLKFKRRR